MKPLNPGWRFALPWAITLRPVGASEGLNGYAVGREETGVECHVWGGMICVRVMSLEPGYIEYFDGDGAICLEPQRGGIR